MNNQGGIVINDTSANQSASHGRHAVVYTLIYIIISAIIPFVFHITTPGVINLSGVIIPACCYLFLGIFFVGFLYPKLTFLCISNYTGSITYAFIVFAGVLATSLAVGLIKGNVSVTTSLFNSCLFLLPYTIYQTWLFYSRLLLIGYNKIWYLPEHTSQIPKATVFLNSIYIKIRMAPMHGTAEEIYETTVPGRMSIGDMFNDFILNEGDSEQKKPVFEDVSSRYFGWQFFAPSFLGLGTRPLDADLSLDQNSIKNNAIIIAKRIPRQLSIAQGTN